MLLLPWSENRALPVPPARDFRLVVLAVGEWRGDFGTDRAGRGGLAALHTLTRRTRERLAVGRGRVLLVHAGDLTGAATRAEFHRRLLPPGMNLPRYLGFDALALSPRENQFLFDLSFLPDFRFTRAVEISRGLPLALSPAVSGYRIAPGQDYNIFLSGWTANTAGAEQEQVLKNMHAELARQTGLDLRLLLVGTGRLDPEDRNVAHKLLGLAPEQNPYDLLPARPCAGKKARELPGTRSCTPTNPFLIVEAGAQRDQFRQLLSGAHYCSIRGRAVCRVEYTFRDHQLIGVDQRFIDLNADDRSRAWIPPDRRLVKILRKERERRAAPVRDPRGEPVKSNLPREKSKPVSAAMR